MSYIKPEDRIPIMFSFGEKISNADKFPLIVFYDEQKSIIAKCQFSDDEVSLENKRSGPDSVQKGSNLSYEDRLGQKPCFDDPKP